MNRLGFIVFSILFSSIGFTQSVSNDLTFNPEDIGFDQGKGCDQKVQVSAVQSDGKIVIAGDFDYVNGTELSVARLYPNGNLDTTFHPPTMSWGSIYDLKIQTDGKIILVGEFIVYDGISQSGIARLNSDGSLDSTFIMNGWVQDAIKTVAIQPDGKLIIGGVFGSVWGQNRSHIARLNANGTLDTSFICTGTDTYGDVNTCDIQVDGKILVGGGFSTMNGIPSNRLARLNPDGSIDPTFVIGTGTSGIVYKALELPDGKLLVSGTFSDFNGTNCKNIVRLLSDGTPDTTFHSENTLMYAMNNRIVSFAIQADNKIVIGGIFHLTSSTGASYQYMARLKPDGTEDITYASMEVSDEVYTCSLQPDGKVIIGGLFVYVGGIRKNYIARLKEDGLQDSTFNWGLGIDGMVYGSALQPDGKIILVGNFEHVNGSQYKSVVRLEPNGQVDIGFSPVNIPVNLTVCLLQPDGKILVANDYMYLARLNSDGTLDSAFSSPFSADYTGGIHTLSLYSDGRIFVGGDFYNSITENFTSVARLLTNGDFDSGFYLGLGINNTVLTSAIQSDGKVIIGGDFTQVNGIPRSRLARLLVDGGLDYSYNPIVNSVVSSCTLQPDGKLIIGGSFTTVNNTVHKVLARLDESGSIDNSFQTEIGLYGTIKKIAVLPDGKILACGNFSTYKFLQLRSLARFQSHGELDYTFNTGDGPNHLWVNTFEIQPDEKIITAGEFTAFDGVGRNRVTRLEICESTLGPEIDVTECNNYTWTNGQTYVVSGNFLRIIPNQQGCDSILRLNLTLNHTNSTTNVSSCGSYTWTNGQTYSQTGYYSQTLINSVSCDSIANLNLTILQKPSSLIQNNNDGTITAFANFGQWIDCELNLPIPGATSNLFAPFQNGTYAFVLTLSNGCSDTSDCINITDLRVNSFSDLSLSISPNPTTNQITIKFSGPDAELTVYDLQGKVVLKDSIQNHEAISFENFERGVYLFDLRSSNGKSIQRVVKQ